MTDDKFAVFIVSHGRPEHVKTLRTLDTGNYTGDTYIVIDDEDETAPDYFKKFGDMVIQFSKAEAAKTFDVCDNFQNHRSDVYVRNMLHGIAADLGLTHFLVLDDDYSVFQYRAIKDGRFIGVTCKQLDRLFSGMVGFLDVSGALTVAFAQGGDFIGGKDNINYRKGILRKAMNTFFCKVDRPWQMTGRINEDVNAYVTLGGRGELFFTVVKASIVQTTTQQTAGGLTETYLDLGTYVKSFYTVMQSPSNVKICKMGDSHMRLHHRINWNSCVPKILSERWKK